MQPRPPESFNDFGASSASDSGSKTSAKESTGSSVRVPLPKKPMSSGGSISAESLTKATNPRVFGNRNVYMKDDGVRYNGDPESGFAGGTSTSGGRPATGSPQSLSQ